MRFISDRIVVVHKGRVMEIAETEELFRYPMHQYTKSLMSAIPIPDQILEKKKKLFVCKPKVYGADEEQPQLVDIGNSHMAFGNSEEIEGYRAL